MLFVMHVMDIKCKFYQEIWAIETINCDLERIMYPAPLIFCEWVIMSLTRAGGAGWLECNNMKK